MREANKGMRDQRDKIINVSDKNAQIAKGLNEGNKIIVEMSRREFFYKIGLYFVIFALLITIVVVVINRILGK
jgi:t-SNARE complex subunit (syntaxin)